MSIISEIFSSSYREAWKNINPQLKQNIHPSTLNGYANSRSHTLNSLINSSCYAYGQITPYKILAGMCELLTNKPLNIIPKYMCITSEMASTLTLNDIYTELPNNATYNHIIIYHIPKGKSYLRRLLDENNTLIRLKQIETYAIENTNHFLRIYKGIGNTGPNDIIIFTDYVSMHLIHTIFIMLPNLLNITLQDLTDVPEAQHTHLTDYNKKVISLRKLFEYLYKFYINNNETITFESFSAELFKLTTEFAKLFNFEETRLTTFAQSLAKAKNNNANRHFTRELDSTNSTINRLENDLENYYNKRLRLQQQLLTVQNTTTEDIKPFMDTINNTKAIEVLSASETEMRLRITAPVQYFTPSDFERYENNVNSTYNQEFKTSDAAIRSVLHKIFITREYKLLMQGIIKLTINTNYLDSIMSANAQANNLTDFTEFPNPHLYHFNCWGPARSEMAKNITEGNYELVVMQMVAAVQTINIAEHASFVNNFLKDIQNPSFTKTRFHIIDQNNKTYNYNEIIEHETALLRENTLKEAKETLNNSPKQGYVQIEIPDDDSNWDDPAENIITEEGDN